MTYTVRIGASWTTAGPVGGVFANIIAPTRVLKYSDHWRAGCQSATFTMALGEAAATPEIAHPVLRVGSLVEILDCGFRVWLGTITATPTEASDAAEFSCEGLSAAFVSLVTSGVTSIATAASAGVSRGFRLIPDANLPGRLSAKSDLDKQLNTLAGLLEESSVRTGYGWGVDADGRLAIILPTSTSAWTIKPDTPAIPTVADEYVTSVIVRYVTATNTDSEPTAWAFESATDLAVQSWLGRPQEVGEDLSTHGLLNATQARAIAAAMLADESRRLTYAAPIQLDPDQITTPGGIPGRFSLIRVGQRVTHHGHLISSVDPRGGIAPTWVIGQREVDVNANTVTLSPTGLAPRTRTNTDAALARYVDKRTELT